MAIYTIRTTSGREEMVMDMLESNVKSKQLEIYSIFHPAEIKAYVFVEGGLGAIQKGMQGLMHTKGLIEKPVRLEEIRHFLEQKKTRIMVSEGDLVEIIGGPFRGERGEIKRIDKVKDEVTIELLEASIPIPVTIATEFIKIIKKAKSDEASEAREHVPAPQEGSEEETEEKEEGSAFDLQALKEREEARAAPGEPEQQPETKEAPAEAKEEKPAEAKPGEEENDEPEGILAELEMETKKKKKSRELEDYEDY
ncbi:MAG: transcription elongation factor Spt5 [Candidatus Aenigmatarchaeota archaeon]|nr:MAG: transcription elongation factor Spt5 [Candidatus Aenigmarchaeota archaeon]